MHKGKCWTEKQLPISSSKEEIPSGNVTLNNEMNLEENKNHQQHRGGFLRSIKLYFREYCLNSSLHGIRYLGEKGRSRTERVWWLLIFIASILLCSQLIYKTWVKWDSTPVIVSFAETPTPIWQVPFPAVTICSETKVRQRVFNFTEAYHRQENISDLSPEELKRFEDVSLICDSHLYLEGGKTTDRSAIDFIEEVAPSFDEMLMVCKWTNQLGTNCSDLFSPSLTEEGRCYTFNMLDGPDILTSKAQNKHYLNHGFKAEWSLDTGYKKGADMNVYPRRALGSGIKAGLTILLRAYEQDLDYICRGPVQGFKILLHNPEETPRVSQQYFRAPLNQEVIVAVQPDMMTTSEGLRSYDPARRHCYFPNEKNLTFFKIYTQQNCEIECLTNYTLNECGCVSYHMPRSSDTPICGSGSTKCVAMAQNSLLLREVKSELAEFVSEGTVKNISLQRCDCLPGCTSLTYNAETSQADFNWVKMFHAYKADFDEFPGIQMTRVNIFFKDTQFITSRRSELYGQTDFLANCGGLLGLFMGFSFLSLVEIVYFLTLRLCCNIKMHGRKMWNAVKVDSSTNKQPVYLKQQENDKEN